MVSDHYEQHAATVKGSMSYCYSKESRSPSMNWKTNWNTNLQLNNTENSTKMWHITTPCCTICSSSSLLSSTEQCPKGNGAFSHIGLDPQSSLSLLENWVAYRNASTCSLSDKHLVGSPFGITPLDALSRASQKVNEPPVMQAYKSDAGMKLSHTLDNNLARLVSDPTSLYSTSNLTHCFQSSTQQRKPFYGALHPINPVVEEGLLHLPHEKLLNSSTLDCIVQLPLDSLFSERATSFSSLINYNQSSAMSAQVESAKATCLCFGEMTPGIDASTTTNLPLQKDAFPRSTMAFMAGYEDVRNRLLNQFNDQMAELSSTPNCFNFDIADLRMNAGHSQIYYPAEGHNMQEPEISHRLYDETSVDLCRDLLDTEDSPSNKKRRLGNKDEQATRANDGWEASLEESPKGVEKTGNGNAGQRQKAGNSCQTKEAKRKRVRTQETENKNAEGKSNKAIDSPKTDYIHVRARRGQATDSHSLAERVRREKISERMGLLQDLVPGCCKITGKTTMLDEIINYVRCLQNQVEFLSMKLASLSPRSDFKFDSIFVGEAMPPACSPIAGETVTGVGACATNLSHHMLQTSFPFTDFPENFNIGVGNGVGLQTSLDRATITANLAINNGFSQL